MVDGRLLFSFIIPDSNTMINRHVPKTVLCIRHSVNYTVTTRVPGLNNRDERKKLFIKKSEICSSIE